MKFRLSYIYLIAGLAATSCTDVVSIEEPVHSDGRLAFCASNARMITKSGLEYESFEVDTKYLLYGVEVAAEYDWANAVLNKARCHENKDHYIYYGPDLHFNEKTYDFYGATICSTGNRYPDDTAPADSKPVIRLSMVNNVLDDLMYSGNLKGCTRTSGLLQMNFIHALSKIQVEVSKQNDSDKLANAIIHSITLQNTRSSGDLDIVDGSWTYPDETESRVFTQAPVTLTTSAAMIKDSSDEDAEMLIFPNEDGLTLSLEILYSINGGEIKSVVCDILAPRTAQDAEPDRPFLFKQNHRYTLTVTIANDGLQIVTVLPKVYEWIDIDVPSYLGQPVTFGNLMWMDRNLGAISADYENDWYNTIGHYFQFGRNIPYIMDVDKFKAYVAEDKNLPYTLPDHPSNLYDKLYVMYYDRDNLYSNVPTNMILNECLYRFHPDEWTDNEEKNKHIKNLVECIYTYDHLGNRVHGIRYVDEGDDTELIRSSGYFWGSHLNMTDEELSELHKFGYGGSDLIFPTIWTYKDTKGADYWKSTKDDPCPKGWRLPTKEDLEVLMPTVSINWEYKKDGNTSTAQPYPQTVTTDTEDIRYGKTDDGNHICFIMKNKNTKDAYRLRIMSHYVPDGKENKRYFSISRYSVTKKPTDNTSYNEDLSHYLDGNISPTSKETTMWANPIETIKYPACGFIVPDSDVININSGQIDWAGTISESARPDLRSFGFGTVLRTSDVYEYDEAGNEVNDYNYVQYLSTTDYQLSIEKMSRRSLGDQIRCVRDINAVD